MADTDFDMMTPEELAQERLRLYQQGEQNFAAQQARALSGDLDNRRARGY